MTTCAGGGASLLGGASRELMALAHIFLAQNLRLTFIWKWDADHCEVPNFCEYIQPLPSTVKWSAAGPPLAFTAALSAASLLVTIVQTLLSPLSAHCMPSSGVMRSLPLRCELAPEENAAPLSSAAKRLLLLLPLALHNGGGSSVISSEDHPFP